MPGKVFDLWGYNGSAPGPTIEVVEGDRVRILFENRLPEPTTVHWHGLEVPIEMDGVPAISQPEVEPGGRFTYEFTLHQHGTFFYHSHGAMQEMMGMLGLFIIHPQHAVRAARPEGLRASCCRSTPSCRTTPMPNSLSMEFNWLTFNGKAAPATTPMLVKLGERVRLRIVNIGMDHHPIHLHGMQFEVTGTEGGRIPERALVSAEHGARRRGAGARHRVPREVPGRLDAALPPAAPHDEPDGLDGRARWRTRATACARAAAWKRAWG